MTSRVNLEFRNVNGLLPGLMKLFDQAPIVDSRAGLTREFQFSQIHLTDPSSGKYDCNAERKSSLPQQIAETAWVLAGRDDLDFLEHYLPQCREFSDDGKTWRAAYGPRLRNWHGVDQLHQVIQELKDNPNSRRAVIQIFDPALDYVESKDIPCNNWLHFLVRDEKLHLNVGVRSNDAMWGLTGINLFEWTTLLEIVASILRVPAGSLTMNISSLHLYERHWDKAKRIATGNWYTPRSYPRAGFFSLAGLDAELKKFFEVERAIRENKDATAINLLSSEMLRVWATVLAKYWGVTEGSTGYAQVDSALETSPKRKHKVEFPSLEPGKKLVEFVDYVDSLHREKDEAYGNSWIRRGEVLGVQANIARKIDRLGGSETKDETSVDTCIDLLVYLTKYQDFLEQTGDPMDTYDANGETHQERIYQKFRHQSIYPLAANSYKFVEGGLRYDFETLIMPSNKAYVVEKMIKDAGALAFSKWLADPAYRNGTRSWNPEA